MRRCPASLSALALLAALAAGCGSYSSATSGGETAVAATPKQAAPKVHRLASGLVYEDLVLGAGTMAEPGGTVSVHYTGRLADGTKFDSSLDRGIPYTFQLGAGSVIQGWEQGIKGMRPGGKRKLTIPPDLGYGARGYGNGLIPPNSTLHFDLELLEVK